MQRACSYGGRRRQFSGRRLQQRQVFQDFTRPTGQPRGDQRPHERERSPADPAERPARGAEKHDRHGEHEGRPARQHGRQRHRAGRGHRQPGGDQHRCDRRDRRQHPARQRRALGLGLPHPGRQPNQSSTHVQVGRRHDQPRHVGRHFAGGQCRVGGQQLVRHEERRGGQRSAHDRGRL